jgi:CubicO group peptidase (beta-lactamase class C family)
MKSIRIQGLILALIVISGCNTPGPDENMEQYRESYVSFLNCTMIPDIPNPWEYYFFPGEFPGVRWDRPELVKEVLGEFPLKITWYNSGMQEVDSAATPGRYVFIAEGTAPGGQHVVRSSTLYCWPEEWWGWNENLDAQLAYFPDRTISRVKWDQHQEAISGYAGRIILLSILNQKEGAILMSFLDEVEKLDLQPSLVETPGIRDQEYHLALRRKLLNLEDKWDPLAPPKKIPESAPTLQPGSDPEAGFKKGTAEKIREICTQWFEVSGEPFDILIARHGVVILHEAFGENESGKMTLQTPTEMASITKLVTGLLFAQFVEQGLLSIDGSIGNVLPDFPVEGEKNITFRHCFTHTTGLYHHEEYGGLHNPCMDNVVANYLEFLEPGKVHQYNGMGYNLAGRAMEMVTGKSVFRMMRENLFDPLEMKDTYLYEDLGFSTFSTAGDFGKLGQMILNRGSYGELQFFSPEVFEKLLPVSLTQFYPELDVEWGIGFTNMSRKGEDGEVLLSDQIVGHGSATSAILNVDLEHGIVLTQTRKIGGKEYHTFYQKVLLALEEGLMD